MAARRSLRLYPDRFVISTLGFITYNKQYNSILRALMQLPPPLRQHVRYIIAGEMRPEEYDVRRVIIETGVQDCVVLTGFVTEIAMEEILLASDLILNLRYPTFGESSGSAARALGLGCALAVTDGGSYAELPDDVCFRLPPKVDPSQEILDLILETMNDADQLAVRRVAALTYARTVLDPARLADRYTEILLDSGGGE